MMACRSVRYSFLESERERGMDGNQTGGGEGRREKKEREERE